MSFLIGLIFNFLNPNGIPLIRQERNLEFANDSAVVLDNDSLSLDIKPPDTANTSSSSNFPDHINDVNTKEVKPSAPEFSKPLAIKIDQAYQLFNKGIKFIDARMPEEFEEGHIRGAINIPFDGDESYREVLKTISKDETLVTYCSGTDCELSILLGDELFEKGYHKVYIFFGGWNDWVERGYPISKGTQ